MRALRAHPADNTGPRVTLEADVPEPELQSGWAVLRVLASAYTAHDLRAASGLWSPKYAVTLGRQCVGVIEDAEPDNDAERERVTTLKGVRAIPSVHVVNADSQLVRAGLPGHDPDRRTLGVTIDGTLAERLAVPIMNLHAVPERVETEHAVLAEAVGGAVHAAAQLHLQNKAYITVLGDGRQGLLCAQAMATLNASVRVVGKHPQKLGVCERLGLRHRHIDDVGRRMDQDVVVDCTGTARGFNDAIGMIRPRGKLLLRSTLERERTEAAQLAAVVDREIEVVGSRDGSVAEGLLAIESGRVRCDALLSARCRLGDAATDIARAAAEPERGQRLVTVVQP